jgi:hypothetical protein
VGESVGIEAVTPAGYPAQTSGHKQTRQYNIQFQVLPDNKLWKRTARQQHVRFDRQPENCPATYFQLEISPVPPALRENNYRCCLGEALAEFMNPQLQVALRNIGGVLYLQCQVRATSSDKLLVPKEVEVLLAAYGQAIMQRVKGLLFNTDALEKANALRRQAATVARTVEDVVFYARRDWIAIPKLALLRREAKQSIERQKAATNQ